MVSFFSPTAQAIKGAGKANAGYGYTGANGSKRTIMGFGTFLPHHFE